MGEWYVQIGLAEVTFSPAGVQGGVGFSEPCGSPNANGKLLRKKRKET